jgi:hypothetical protein
MSPRSFARAAALVAVVPLLAGRPLHAEEEDAPTGTRVRVVKKTNEKVVGRLAARSPERLAIETESGRAPVQIPYSQIARLQVSEGRNRGKGAGVGVLVGLVAAGAIYAATTSDCSEIDCGKRFALIAGPSVAVGALVGLKVAPERWRNVDRVPDVTSLDRSPTLRLAVLPSRRGFSAMASLAF